MSAPLPGHSTTARVNPQADRYDWCDIGITALAVPFQTMVSWWVVEIVGHDDSGTLFYWRAGDASFEGDLTDPREAERVLDGNIKWDGCANFSIGPDDCMAHLCGWDTAQNWITMMRRVWETTAWYFDTGRAPSAGFDRSDWPPAQLHPSCDLDGAPTA